MKKLMAKRTLIISCICNVLLVFFLVKENIDTNSINKQLTEITTKLDKTEVENSEMKTQLEIYENELKQYSEQWYSEDNYIAKLIGEISDEYYLSPITGTWVNTDNTFGAITFFPDGTGYIDYVELHERTKFIQLITYTYKDDLLITFNGTVYNNYTVSFDGETNLVMKYKNESTSRSYKLVNFFYDYKNVD